MLKKYSLYVVALLGVLVLFNSCKKEYESIQTIDEAKIQAYLKQNNITNSVKDPSGFYYQVVDQGTGSSIQNKDSVFYNLVIKSLSGQVYYSTAADANEGTYLGYVIPEPYRTAMYAINRGGKLHVIVPSYLAYGRNGNNVVPPNEVIVADIEVFKESAQWQIDDRKIKDFIAAKGLTMTKHPSRIYYQIITQGTGVAIESSSSTVSAKYVGRYLSGTVFDQTTGDDPYTSVLGDNISGWEKILIGVKKGTKLRVLIPSDLAYGSRTDTSISPNSVLDFDIEVVDVVN